jgi:hypothetical protein
MVWADTVDRALKTAIGAFKSSATYTRALAPSSPIVLNGVFDVPHQSVDPQTGVPVQSTQPRFGIRLADLPAVPASGDQLVRAGVTYRVLEVEEDGQGGAELILGVVG